MLAVRAVSIWTNAFRTLFAWISDLWSVTTLTFDGQYNTQFMNVSILYCTLLIFTFNLSASNITICSCTLFVYSIKIIKNNNVHCDVRALGRGVRNPSWGYLQGDGTYFGLQCLNECEWSSKKIRTYSFALRVGNIIHFDSFVEIKKKKKKFNEALDLKPLQRFRTRARIIRTNSSPGNRGPSEQVCNNSKFGTFDSSVSVER